MVKRQPADLYKQEGVRLALNDLEKISAEKTHEFNNVRAAARILYGAFECGEIEEPVFMEADEQLREIDTKHWSNKDDKMTPSKAQKEERGGLDINTYIARARQLREKIFAKPEQPLRASIPSGKILLIDDEYEKYGWNVVFDAIFGSDHVEYQDDVTAAAKYVDLHSEQTALLLLDLRLKDALGQPSPEVGLELLKSLKGSHVDLPIIVFSGVDETVYTRKCLNAGASDYYVKEVSEKDRIKYYLKFKSVISDGLSNPEWRTIWRRINRLPKPSPYLLKAYYFLTSDPDDFRVRLIFSQQIQAQSDPSIHSECVLHCANAVEEWVNAEINSRKKRLEKKYSDIVGEPIENLPLRSGSKLSKLKILSAEKYIDSNQRGRIDELLDLRRHVAHAGKRKRVLTQQDSYNAFDLALTVLEDSTVSGTP